MARLNKTQLLIRAKRGTASQIKESNPAPYQLQGEFAYATDTKELYVSDGSSFLPVNYATNLVGVDNEVVMINNEAVFV